MRRWSRNIDDYVAQANDSLLVIPQIEDIRTVAVVGEIIGLGVDALCIGPNDLSGSAGLLRQHDHATVRGALERILETANGFGMAVCMGIVVPAEKQREWIDRGARMALVTSDVELLVHGATAALDGVRALSAAPGATGRLTAAR